MDNDPLGRQLLVQALLIGVNAFFASSEMALVSLNTAVLKKRAENGGADGKRAKRLLKIAEEPTGFLSAIQIAITLAGFLGSAFAADSFSGRIVNWLFDVKHVSFISRGTAETLSVIVITLILSYFTLVLGELAPKRIAMHYPDKVADIPAPVVAGVKVVLYHCEDARELPDLFARGIDFVMSNHTGELQAAYVGAAMGAAMGSDPMEERVNCAPLADED